MEDSKKSFRMSGKKEKAEQAIKTDSSDPSKMSKNEARKKIYELEEKLTELRSLLIAEQGRSKELEEIVKAKDLKLRKMQIGEDADNVDSSLAIFHPLSKKGEYTEFYSFDEEDTDDNIIYLDIKSDLVGTYGSYITNSTRIIQLQKQFSSFIPAAYHASSGRTSRLINQLVIFEFNTPNRDICTQPHHTMPRRIRNVRRYVRY